MGYASSEDLAERPSNHAAALGIPAEGCMGEVSCLLERDVRRKWRDFRIDHRLEHEGAFGGQGLLPPLTNDVCGYSIESLRLLLNSHCRRHPHGLGNANDQLGRYVMVQGAPQVAARFPELLRMYKGPPPEVSSEQFYETDPSRGFARGFSIQTLSPLPIGWAEHVLANGHRGAALREYMRDYNHWAVLGGLCELLPLPDNRVTLTAENDRFGMPIARFDYSQCDNDRANIAYAKKTMREIWKPPEAKTSSRSTATPTSSAAAGSEPNRRQASSTQTTGCGKSRTSSSATAA